MPFMLSATFGHVSRFVTIFFIHAVLCLSTNCLSQAKTSNENLSPEFTGQKYFESSGLYYFNNRYYDPALGRFLTPDPLQQYASPYSYADGDPLGRVDPSGLLFEDLRGLFQDSFVSITPYFEGHPESAERSVQNSIERSSQGAVGGQISASAEAIQNVSRSVSAGASLNPSLSAGVEEGSFQDLYYSPELEDRLQAIDEQSLERVLALQNSTEESQIETTTDDSYVETSSIDGESEFMSYYSKDSMKFASSYRSDRSGYYRNDVVRSQWRLAAKKGNFLKFLPRELKGLIIVHKETNNIIREFHKKPGFLKTFLNTVVGRSYLRVMNDFGLLPTHIHADYSSVTISVAPDPNPIPVDQLQKAQKNLSDRLESLNLSD